MSEENACHAMHCGTLLLPQALLRLPLRSFILYFPKRTGQVLSLVHAPSTLVALTK